MNAVKPAASEPESWALSQPMNVRSAALIVLAVVAIILMLQYAQSMVIPIVLSMLISYALEPVVAWLVRRFSTRSTARSSCSCWCRCSPASSSLSSRGSPSCPSAWNRRRYGASSRASRMNAVAIFVGLLFWGWVWNIWGMLLAVPMLMVMKVVCDHVEELHGIGELLGE
jgi:predicted PurR-regulated permease PerM